MPKDRLASFKRARDTSEDSEVVINLEQNGFMPEFYHQVKEIRTKIETIENYVNEVRILQVKILQDDKLTSDLEQLMSKIRILAEKIRKSLRHIKDDLTHREKLNQTETADYRIRDEQLYHLRNSFYKIMHSYNQAQIKYSEACKNRLQNQLEINEKQLDETELEPLLETVRTQIFSGNFVDSQMAQQILKEVQDRHEEIPKIVKSIEEINELMLDLEMLVTTQGEFIDRIVKNTDETVLNVDEAKSQYSQAEKRHRIIKYSKSILTIIGIVGSTDDMNNYRGMSVLPPIAKFLHKQISNYLSLNKIFSYDQHGFRSNYSCESALNRIISQMNSIKSKRLIALFLFIDFKKAFETV
ncbi:unnamed protein product [Brachionus calyciflorus]|uniref:t-SNARE coiled-coil homology domain-containing protein n=1 Tax=Brachionus calyciflorus TaxID=104777 RepID=A0A814GCR0_9BILA|nr:unnamed protein product [Brachionus calyciflorus]